MRLWIAVILVALSVAPAPLPSTAPCRADTQADASSVVEAGVPEDAWWGVAGSVVCGGELWLLRNRPEIGINPYALAAGIAGCALALLDAAAN
jgi:hypothetical protein